MTTAIWIVSGKRYIAEAQASAASLKAVNPEIVRTLLTPDTDVQVAGFDMTIQLSTRLDMANWAHDSIRYFGEAMELVTDDPILYFDSDTYICKELGGLVGATEYADFVGVYAPRRAWGLPNIPGAFAELNVGVFAFWRSSARVLFADWLRKYEQGDYKDNDQSPLRAALWDSSATAWVAPIEYNFRFEYGGQVHGPVYVLHGRSDDYPKLAAKVNEHPGFRAWHVGELK